MEDLLTQTVQDLLGRQDGPFAFRLILQPLTAAVIACRAGFRDAQAGRPPYAWALLTDRTKRRERLGEGWRELSRVFALAVVIDLIYELIVFRRIYPFQSLVVATVLALLPYPLFRGLLNRITRHWRQSHG